MLGYSLEVDWSHRPSAPDTIAYRVEACCIAPGTDDPPSLGDRSSAVVLGPDWTTISDVGHKCMNRSFILNGILVHGGWYGVRVFAFNSIG